MEKNQMYLEDSLEVRHSYLLLYTIKIIVMKRRTETEIIALILESINGNGRAAQTRIMFEAYLSYAQLKRYLSLLLQKGLIEYQKVGGLFTMTEKGMHFLQVCNQFNQLHTSNMFAPIKKYRNEGEEDTYLICQQTKAIHQLKCEKCQKLLLNLKESKLHKLECHSY